MSTYFAILTEVGEAKLANAIALGQTLKLKTMAVGDGNGNLPMPSRTQKALVHEVRRAGLNQLSIDPANASQIIVEQVLPENVGGWWIREIGIYDEAGDLCAVANCPPSYKPVMAEGSARTQVVRIVLIVASTAAIELKIDPSVVLATRKYVDDQDITVRAYSDAQLAKHLAALDPHPLLAKVAYVDQQDTSARAYGDQQLAKHQASLDPHPLLAKVAYVDQQDASARTYGDQQLAKHQAAADPHPLLAKVTYVDQQDTSARAYGDQQLAKHQAAADPHPLLAKVAYVDQQDTSARTYGDQQLAKHQAAADPHPLLAKVAYVDQQDTSARTYGDQQLAKHQAAADPHPLLAKVAYVDQQDANARAYSDQQLAKQLGNKSRTIGIPASTTLTPDSTGCVFVFNGNNVAAVLPLSSAVPSGAEISFMSSNASGCSIARQGTDKLVNGNSNFLTSMALAVGDTATFVCSKNEGWYLRDGSLSLAYSARFGAALVTQGYQKLPSGKIEQWGQVFSDASGTAIVAFSIAFPTAAHFVVPLEINSGAGYATVTQITPGSFRIHFWNAAGGPAPAGVLANWFALGS
ncbi:phage tail protein [Janthinobacterium kumbetense]|uniref:Phage tail protein n=1 Tax=Janthinobacterium kumbetense TaxID=2950280 RepID=A0ABT0WUS2_9BURK|nr:phage tail protein [Janthinobacterium kumbetense]MCM2567792.1 phage tail protein [Janthinobacterium kumbetense]